MNGDVALSEERSEFPQIAFLFDPKLDPIKDNVKSFVVLKSLMSSEKPMTLDEVKGICSEKFKIDLTCEELSDVINKWYACIDKKNERITLTEQGRNKMHSVEEESKRIQTEGFEWFKDEMSKSVNKEKIKNNEDKLKHFFIKCVSRASEVDINILKGMSGVADRPLVDVATCLRRLKSNTNFTEFDSDIKDSFYSIIRKLFENPSDKRINRVMYAIQYTSLIRFVLPSGAAIDILKNDLANKKFCLDSNTILSAIFHHDHSHYLVYDTFSKLKQFNAGRLPVFWHNDTHKAVMDVIEASKKFCENMEFFSDDLIYNVCLIASKSPVREYFKESWPNWQSFEKYYRDRYRQLKRHDMATKSKSNINNVEIDEDLLEKTKNLFEMYLKRGRRVMKNDKELTHDSQLLVWVHLLRQQDTSKHITPNYWIVTLDNSLINFEKTFRKQLFSSESHPLCVSKKSLHLLLDPYFMARSIEIDETFDRAKLSVSATIKGIDVEPFYTIKELNEIYNSRPTEQLRLIGKHLDEENLRETAIYGGLK